MLQAQDQAPRKLSVAPSTPTMFGFSEKFDLEDLVILPKDPPPKDIGTKSSLVDLMSLPYNQLGAESCAAFAILPIVDYYYPTDLAGSDLPFASQRRHLSAAHLIDAGSKRFGRCDTGSLALGEAFQIASDAGIVEEADWPFDGKTICWNPAPDISGKRLYTLKTTVALYVRSDAPFLKLPASPLPVVRYGLAIGPVAVDIPVWRTWDGDPVDVGWEWNSNGDVHAPAADLPVKNYHGIAIIGHDDARGVFEFQNSWGDWGNHGRGTITYDYIERFCRTATVARR